MKPSLRSLAATVGRALTARKLTIATAESMTGGAIAAACTSIAGSSSWFECAFVTYRLSAKTAILGVERASIEQHGVVSELVARAMAEGALARCRAHIAHQIVAADHDATVIPRTIRITDLDDVGIQLRQRLGLCLGAHPAERFDPVAEGRFQIADQRFDLGFRRHREITRGIKLPHRPLQRAETAMRDIIAILSTHGGKTKLPARHLLGLARLRNGDVEGARRHADRARRIRPPARRRCAG